jgi:hypothetical protein
MGDGRWKMEDSGMGGLLDEWIDENENMAGGR